MDGVFVSPKNTSITSDIVLLANENRFRILPSGFGSALDSSRLVSDSMVILKSGRMNKIKRVVPEDLYVILEPGFPLKNLNQHLEPYNLFYPLADGKSGGTIGGSVATNLQGKSGEKSVQTKEYVLSLEVVNPEGQILNIGARTFKSVSGYDLPRLYVGSWGTLGFITEISLRLVPAGKRKDYPAVQAMHPKREKNAGNADLKNILSGRIKKSLDPNGVFLKLESLL